MYNKINEKDMYAKAVEIAEEKHKNQVDKAGKPYIGHLRAVADGVDGYLLKTVAMLHDIIEDTDMTIDGLFKLGFNREVIMAVNLLTKEKGVSLDEYLKAIKSNELARKVKISDLKHNMQIERIPNPTEKDYERVEKYKEALAYLIS